ncbi:MAG: thioredoxin family protein [Candidatus Spechtbacterales bacterium]|nr:thioredoxin family protein [Candidatus Spechtbacterales bacterium]
MKNLIKQDGLAMPVIVAIIATALVLGGITYYNLRPEGEKMMEEGEDMMEEGEKMMQEGESMMEEGEDMMEEGEKMMEEEGTTMEEGEHMMEEDEGAMMEQEYKGEVLAGSTSPLIVFNSDDYQAALNSEELVVLYFYANWCPVCRAETRDALYPAFNELDNENVVGFRVNYNDSNTDSSEKDLAREFGVAYQHTKVFLKNGERILKAPDSWSKQRYLDEISNAL